MVKRGFADMRWGQIHYRMATPSLPAAQRKLPLVLLHQSPLSSLEYGPLITEIGRDRVVVAIDTPGQGNSDGPPSEASIAEYSAAILDALKALGFGPQKPFDLLGNHTGTSLAIEIALQEPKMVRQIVMTGMYMASAEADPGGHRRIDLSGDVGGRVRTDVQAGTWLGDAPADGPRGRRPVGPAADRQLAAPGQARGRAQGGVPVSRDQEGAHRQGCSRRYG